MTDGTWREIERVEKIQDGKEEEKIEGEIEDLSVSNELNGSTGIKDLAAEIEASKVC